MLASEITVMHEYSAVLTLSWVVMNIFVGQSLDPVDGNKYICFENTPEKIPVSSQQVN